MQPEEIKHILESKIENATADVGVDGNHVMVTVISDAFAGLSPVKKQQLVYGCLQEEIASGVIHAVHMKTFTPEEWAAANA